MPETPSVGTISTRSLFSGRPFPYLSLPIALTLLRAGVAALFMAHAAVRLVTPGSVTQFGRFMEHAGFPSGRAVVIALTAFELAGGVLLALGIRTRVVGSGFVVILLVGIALIHRQLGWFVGEHGTGGSEYSVALLLGLAVIMSADAIGADRLRVANAARNHSRAQSPNAS